MDNSAPSPSSSTILTNDEPNLGMSRPVTTVIEQPITPEPNHTPTVTETPVSKPTSVSFSFIAAGLFISLSTFSIGMAGTFSYFKYFNDSTPLPKTETSGLFLGLSDVQEEISPSATPTLTPDTNLKPEQINKPLSGTLAYINNHQIHILNADRSNPKKLTSDDSRKEHLAISPDGKWLAYTSKLLAPELNRNSGAGIQLLNLQTLQSIEVMKADKFSYSQLYFSPSGKYLSAWVNQGLEAIVINLETNEVITRYGTPDTSGISPIVWIPKTDRISFILKGELFTAEADGTKITSITTDVIGIKTQENVPPLPLPPIWASTGSRVAYHRTNGLFLFDTSTKQEIPVITSPKSLAVSHIPWRAHAFTSSASHLVYENTSAKDGQTTSAYSIDEKKNVSISDIHDTILLHPSKNVILGFPPSTSKEENLEKYSLSTWNMTTCAAPDFRFIRQTAIPSSGYPYHLSSDGVGLIGFSKSAGSVTTIKLMNLDTCEIYDLIKDQGITDIVWLP